MAVRLIPREPFSPCLARATSTWEPVWAGAASKGVHPRWQQAHYVLRARAFTLGRRYRVLDSAGNLVAYCRQRPFKLREDLRFYHDTFRTQDQFRLRAVKNQGLNTEFEVSDSVTGARLGLLRRQIATNRWQVMDGDGKPLGILKDASHWARTALPILLFLAPFDWFVPAKHHLYAEGGIRPVATIRQRLASWGYAYDLHLQPESTLDARVLVALAVCVNVFD